MTEPMEAVVAYLVDLAIAKIKESMRLKPTCKQMYAADGKPVMWMTRETETETRREGRKIEERKREVKILYTQFVCKKEVRLERIGVLEAGEWGPWEADPIGIDRPRRDSD